MNGCARLCELSELRLPLHTAAVQTLSSAVCSIRPAPGREDLHSSRGLGHSLEREFPTLVGGVRARQVARPGSFQSRTLRALRWRALVGAQRRFSHGTQEAERECAGRCISGRRQASTSSSTLPSKAEILAQIPNTKVLRTRCLEQAEAFHTQPGFKAALHLAYLQGSHSLGVL